MQIQIINISEQQKSSKAGKPYTALEVVYKDSSGKVANKNLMPFGDSKGAFESLKGAQAGVTYDVTAVKNAAGFWDWVNATVSTGPAPAATKAGGNSFSGGAKSNFETPEERAKRQVLIVRQSSISAAVGALTPGAKAPLDPKQVIETARLFEDYVFGESVTEADPTNIFNMADDIPL